MNKVQPKTLSGFMELLPNEQVLFNQMVDKIRGSYEKFGFLPIDTPVIEASEVLLAKAGGETEKQLYTFTKGDSNLTLRFDLTVPLAKYVAEYYNQITFPFRRYQIGKVYRGERAQRGRFREFYQCDIDIIGDENLSIINEAEMPAVIYTTFKNLGFDNFTICMNNRKILNGLFESLNLKEISADVMRAIDKFDKIGKDGVEKELKDLNISSEAKEKIFEFIEINGNVAEKINKLKEMNIENKLFNEGVNELETVVNAIKMFGVPEEYFSIDLKIARPLLQTMHKMHRAGVDNYVTHKGRIRKLTPRECLRLMGFKDSFKIVVSDTSMYQQSGNSIVVDVLIAILKELDITRYGVDNED